MFIQSWCGIDYVRQFFREVPKNFLNFHELFKNKKTIIFVPKLVQNQYIDQILAECSLKTTITVNFSSKPSFFKIFGAFCAAILTCYVPKTRLFWSSPLGGDLLKKCLWFRHFELHLLLSTFCDPKTVFSLKFLWGTQRPTSVQISCKRPWCE